MQPNTDFKAKPGSRCLDVRRSLFALCIHYNSVIFDHRTKADTLQPKKAKCSNQAL